MQLLNWGSGFRVQGSGFRVQGSGTMDRVKDFCPGFGSGFYCAVTVQNILFILAKREGSGEKKTIVAKEKFVGEKK